MPNIFAYVMLILWPVISVVMFNKLKTITAVFWTITGGYLILPVKVKVDFPLIPALNKESITAIAALIGCIIIKKERFYLIPKGGIEKWIVVLLLILPIFSILTNSEPVFNGNVWISGLTPFDAISKIITIYLILIPFIIGTQLIKSYNDQLLLFKYLVIAGIVYSLPILFEIRMSPQLHTWIYGFFPHTFLQQMRDDGFRAVVFLGHGLLIAMFLVLFLGSATILWKNRIAVFGISPLIIIIFCLVLLVLSKTLGALLLAAIIIATIAWLPSQFINRIAQLITILVILYPIAIITDIFPHDAILDFAFSFNADRAQSLEFRLFHEFHLVELAKEKLLFGWGGWGRNRLSTSVTDGYWILAFGNDGIIGLGAFFGLVITSIWKGVNASNNLENKNARNLMAGHILIVAIFMIDQLPNDSLRGYIWIMIGALISRSAQIMRTNFKDE